MTNMLNSVFQSLGEKIGVSAATAGIIVIAAAVLLLAAVLAAIFVPQANKRKKLNKGVKVESEKDAEKPLECAEKQEKTKENKPVYAEKQPENEAKTSENEVNAEENAEKTEEKAMKITEKTPETTQKTAKKPAKTAPAKQEAKSEAKIGTKAEPKRMLGKWRIVIKGENAYIAVLHASNGEVMLTSEIYSTEEGARSGVETIKRGVETGNFVIYRDKGGDYYFKLKSAGNRLLCVGEIYTTRDACEKAAESVKRIAKDSPLMIKVSEGERFIAYTPAEVTPPAKKNQGKWRIEQGENGGFSAKLYANNGQVMLSTEEVASRKTAEKAIESVCKNCAAGNFYIDKDKFGRFYYKLHNVQKSVICTGETYDKVDSVVSAIESVRRFASNAELTE